MPLPARRSSAKGRPIEASYCATHRPTQISPDGARSSIRLTFIGGPLAVHMAIHSGKMRALEHFSVGPSQPHRVCKCVAGERGCRAVLYSWSGNGLLIGFATIVAAVRLMGIGELRGEAFHA